MNGFDELLLRWRKNPDPTTTIALCSHLGVAKRQELIREVANTAETWHRKDLDVMLATGRMYLDAGMLPEAQAALVIAGKIDPKQIAPYRYLGEVLLRRGDAVRSEKVLSRALQLGSRDPELRLWHERATVYVGLQKRVGLSAVAEEIERTSPLVPSIPPPPASQDFVEFQDAIETPVQPEEDLRLQMNAPDSARSRARGPGKPSSLPPPPRSAPAPRSAPPRSVPPRSVPPPRPPSRAPRAAAHSNTAHSHGAALASAPLPSFEDPSGVHTPTDWDDEIPTQTQMEPAEFGASLGRGASPGNGHSYANPWQSAVPAPAQAPRFDAVDGPSGLGAAADDQPNPPAETVLWHLAQVGVFEPSGGARPIWEAAPSQRSRGLWFMVGAAVLAVAAGGGAY
jgi:hypothetical protein